MENCAYYIPTYLSIYTVEKNNASNQNVVVDKRLCSCQLLLFDPFLFKY